MFARSAFNHNLRLRVLSRGKATTAAGSSTEQEASSWRVWVTDTKGLWPVIAITIATVGYGLYQMRQNANSPDWKHSIKERKTMDYLENDKDPRDAIAWQKSPTASGPQIIHKLNPYPTTKSFDVKNKPKEVKS
jgi:hypothetical protein